MHFSVEPRPAGFETLPDLAAPPTTDPSDPAVDELGAAVLGLLHAWWHVGRCGTERARTQLAAVQMVTLIGEGEHRPTELSEHRGVDQSVISRQIGELHQQGLVDRRADPADRRACLVRLTPAGRQLLEHARRLRQHWLRTALARTPGVDLPGAVALLTALTAELEAHAAHLGPARR